MVDLLTFINDKLNEIGIPYEFGEWTSTVTYPYFVGSFDEIDYRYEDGCTLGTFTLNGWSRGSKITLMEAADTIKEAFADLQAVVDDRCFFIRYGGSMSVPSGEADLFRVMITLHTSEWKGD